MRRTNTNINPNKKITQSDLGRETKQANKTTENIFALEYIKLKTS